MGSRLRFIPCKDFDSLRFPGLRWFGLQPELDTIPCVNRVASAW